MRTVTITGYERPKLFAAVIQDLAACSFEGWHLFAGIEPSLHAAQFHQICAAHLPESSFTITQNATLQGDIENPLSVLERAFDAGSTINLHIEEDLRLAPDTLDMVAWYDNARQPNWVALNLLAGCCGTTGYLSDPDYPDWLTSTRAFNSLGFATDTDSWRHHLHPVWDLFRHHRWVHPRYLDAYGWDWAVSGAIYANPALKVIQPVAARATHVGATGLHCNPTFQSAAFDNLSLAVGTDHAYQLRPQSQLPKPLRSHFEMYEQITALRAELEDRRPRKTARRLKRKLASRFLSRQSQDKTGNNQP